MLKYQNVFLYFNATQKHNLNKCTSDAYKTCRVVLLFIDTVPWLSFLHSSFLSAKLVFIFCFMSIFKLTFTSNCILEVQH